MEGVEKGTQQLKLGKSSLSKTVENVLCVTLVYLFYVNELYSGRS